MDKDINQPITIKDFGEFTDEVLLPGVERTVSGVKNELSKEIMMNRNGINTVLEKLQHMQEAIDRIGVQQDKEKLEIKVIDWLSKRVDVLEKKLGVMAEPIPQE